MPRTVSRAFRGLPPGVRPGPRRGVADTGKARSSCSKPEDFCAAVRFSMAENCRPRARTSSCSTSRRKKRRRATTTTDWARLGRLPQQPGQVRALGPFQGVRHLVQGLKFRVQDCLRIAPRRSGRRARPGPPPPGGRRAGPAAGPACRSRRHCRRNSTLPINSGRGTASRNWDCSRKARSSVRPRRVPSNSPARAISSAFQARSLARFRAVRNAQAMVGVAIRQQAHHPPSGVIAELRGHQAQQLEDHGPSGGAVPVGASLWLSTAETGSS